MTTHVALLYSIILGDKRRLNMGDLRALAQELGLGAPRTLAATGNLVFEAADRTVPQLEGELERAFEQRFGRHFDIIARPAERWRRLVDANPFPEEAARDGSRIIVRVSRHPVADTVAATLARYAVAGERFHVIDGDIWVHCTQQPSTSKLLSVLTPRRLGGCGTLRNWNTARGIADRHT